MFCMKCGSSLPPQSTFCPNCGNAVQLQPPQPPLPQPPPYSPGGGSSRPLKLILGIGLPVLAVLTVVVMFAAGILSWPGKSPGTGETTSRQTTTIKPTKKPTPTTEQPTESTTAESTEATTAVTSPETPAATSGSPIPDGFTDSEILDYFEDIALKREYGGGAFDGVVCRWEQPVLVEISGQYTEDDYDWLISHINLMNSIDGVPEINVVESGGNFHITFDTLDRLPEVVSGYVEGNWGFIYLNWNGDGQIVNADMAIASDVTNQLQRNHLILEEFTQGFGLLNDSQQYPDSIFQIEWTETQALLDLDILLVRMLYCPMIQAGMKEGVRDALADWLMMLA